MKIEIYLASQCRPNPGMGAWAYVVAVDNILTDKKSYLIPNQTNSEMDLAAAIISLEHLIKKNSYLGNQIIVHSYSQYLVMGANEWMKKWKLNDFSSVKNPKHWRRLNRAIKICAPSFNFVKKRERNRYISMAEDMCERMYQEANQFLASL